MEKRFVTFETVSGPIAPDMEQSVAKPIFSQIVENLKKPGATIVEGPDEWDSYGWYADFHVGSAKLNCMLQRSDSWLLIINSNRSLMDRIKGRHYETELDEFAGLVVAAVQEAAGVPAGLFNSEAEFQTG